SEALSHLFVKFKGVLWLEAIVVLIRILGVYPPGSFVQLSDQSIGMVININAKNRLRPLVLLYTAEMSTVEAVVIDLEQQEELSITQNLRPRDLPLEIVEYLSPKRMINYTLLNPTGDMATLPST
ncbi:MAG: metal-dependent phosphohydrolase, partial [Nitrospirota bacterium]|nr:metal-dependent phosphohydrolase [Nitrospirota bacterium]